MTGKRESVERSTARDQSSEESDDGNSALGVVAEVAKDAGQASAPLLAGTLLDALFSDTVRARVLQEAEEGLRKLMDSTLDAIPASASYGRLQGEMDRAEQQLHVMLQEAIDEMFSGPARAELQAHIEEAARQIAEGDLDTAKDQIAEALQSLLSETLKVLQTHWAQTLRLLLGITARALEATFTSHLKEAFGSITVQPAEEAEEKIEPLQKKLAAKADELRDRLIEARDDMQERLTEAKAQIQGRLGDRIPGARATGNSRNQSRVGVPPSRRPPAGPSRRPAPGNAPGGLPPSVSR